MAFYKSTVGFSTGVVSLFNGQIIELDSNAAAAAPYAALISAGFLQETTIAEANIKVGVEILNVEGTFTSDADATADDIAAGKTAYVNGAKVTGTSEAVDTSDADAVAEDIALGKTAYVNGVKITGTAE